MPMVVSFYYSPQSNFNKIIKTAVFCIGDKLVHIRKEYKMSSTSQKHRNFVAEPMGEKSVTDLAGVGEVLGKRLDTAGFDKAYVVLGQFLVLKKDKELFQEWMKETCSANSKQSADCYQCLKDWCDEFL